MAGEELRIEPATVDDVGTIRMFIEALAAEEGFPGRVEATEAELRAALFGPRPAAEAVLGWIGTEPVAFALFYSTFSSVQGRPGLHLDDLFVVPGARGCGVGAKMIAYLAKLATDRSCGRVEWWALRWNRRAIEFYERIGASAVEDLVVFRAQGPALAALAGARDEG